MVFALKAKVKNVCENRVENRFKSNSDLELCAEFGFYLNFEKKSGIKFFEPPKKKKGTYLK